MSRVPTLLNDSGPILTAVMPSHVAATVSLLVLAGEDATHASTRSLVP